MMASGAQGVILGCTEIGLLIGQSDTDAPLFDTTVIHGKRAAMYAIAK
jgi:aspartate racemase